MKGRRVYPNDTGDLPLGPGDYGKNPEGLWRCVTPNGHWGHLGNHEVTEHDDGTITVNPSILVSTEASADGKPKYRELYHGWLKKGVWTP